VPENADVNRCGFREVANMANGVKSEHIDLR
jgi:hypothetical protein